MTMIFKRIKITEGQRKRAKERYEFKRLNNSMTGGGGNTTGALGEILLIDKYGDKVEDVSTFDYDLIIKGERVEVKTKRQMVYPEPYHYMNIFNFNIEQQCDWYCFIVVDYEHRNGWIVGWKEKEAFFNESKFYKKGDIDDTYFDNPWTFSHDCHCIKVRDLILR